MDLEQLGKYKILSKIGEGAMGVVYKAHDSVLNRYVALKTISSALDAEEELRRRFKREAQSAGQLNHPNIVTVHDFGEDQGRIYMAMELLEGTDLRQLIRSRPILSLEQKLRIMEQMCDGLAFAHSKDVVHRDLKPSNIHVQPNGQVKIMDFGLARLSSSDMTRSGLVMGTPNYMSPEQFQGHKVDNRSDIFSLGAVFYEILSYQKPFDADSMHTIMFKVLQNERAALASLAPDVPAPLLDLVEKALAKEPDERFQSAGDVRAALTAVRRALPGDGEETVFALNAESLFEQTLFETPGSSKPGSPLPGSRPGSSIPGRRSVPPVTARTASIPAHGASRARLYGAVAVLVVALAGALFWLQSRRAQAPAADPGADGMKQQISALTEALVGSQLEQAADKLEGKSYGDAVAYADRVLQLDPRNSRAREIRGKAQATLGELEDVARRAREALQSGRTDEATAALARVLAIDPTHPVAGELSGELNSRFRSQAEDARRLVAESRRQAEPASTVVKEDFQGAIGVAESGETLFRKAQYAQAAQKFLDARDRFDRAKRVARERQAAAVKASGQARAELDELAQKWSAIRDEARSGPAARAPSFQKALGMEAQARELAHQNDVPGASRAYQAALALLADAQAESLKEPAVKETSPAAEARPAPPESAPDSPEPIGRGGGAPRHELVEPARLPPPPQASPAPAAPVRVETGSREATPLVKVAPVYPAVAARAKSEGRVLLEIEVDRDGAPVSIRVVKREPLFEKAAVDAVKQWRWKPFVLNGQTVPFHLAVNVDFKLQGGPRN